MIIDDTPMHNSITSAQIVKVLYPLLVVKTQTGRFVRAELSPAEKTDPLFWEAAENIATAQLWIPFGMKHHQLLDQGWLAPQEPASQHSNSKGSVVDD